MTQPRIPVRFLLPFLPSFKDLLGCPQPWLRLGLACHLGSVSLETGWRALGPWLDNYAWQSLKKKINENTWPSAKLCGDVEEIKRRGNHLCSLAALPFHASINLPMSQDIFLIFFLYAKHHAKYRTTSLRKTLGYMFITEDRRLRLGCYLSWQYPLRYQRSQSTCVLGKPLFPTSNAMLGVQ